MPRFSHANHAPGASSPARPVPDKTSGKRFVLESWLKLGVRHVTLDADMLSAWGVIDGIKRIIPRKLTAEARTEALERCRADVLARRQKIEAELVWLGAVDAHLQRGIIPTGDLLGTLRRRVAGLMAAWEGGDHAEPKPSADRPRPSFEAGVASEAGAGCGVSLLASTPDPV